MSAKLDWRRARPRTGLSIMDEAERMDRDAAARWMKRKSLAIARAAKKASRKRRKK